jgi:hypothetical protein
MPTQIIAVGEMSAMYDTTCSEIVVDGELENVEASGELDGSFEELQESLRVSLKAHFGAGENDYIWIVKTFDDHLICSIEKPGEGTKLYDIAYGIVDNKVVLGEQKEVVRKETYVPVGEMRSGGEEVVTKEEVLKALKEFVTSGEISREELGETVGEVAPVSNELQEVVGEMSVEDVRAAIALKAATDTANAEKAYGEMVQKVVSEKFPNQTANELIMDLFKPAGTTSEEIAGELEQFVAKESISKALNKLFNTASFSHRGESGNATSGTRTKRVSV